MCVGGGMTQHPLCPQSALACWMQGTRGPFVGAHGDASWPRTGACTECILSALPFQRLQQQPNPGPESNWATPGRKDSQLRLRHHFRNGSQTRLTFLWVLSQLPASCCVTHVPLCDPLPTVRLSSPSPPHSH